MVVQRELKHTLVGSADREQLCQCSNQRTMTRCDVMSKNVSRSHKKYRNNEFIKSEIRA